MLNTRQPCLTFHLLIAFYGAVIRRECTAAARGQTGRQANRPTDRQTDLHSDPFEPRGFSERRQTPLAAVHSATSVRLPPPQNRSCFFNVSLASRRDLPRVPATEWRGGKTSCIQNRSVRGGRSPQSATTSSEHSGRVRTSAIKVHTTPQHTQHTHTH